MDSNYVFDTYESKLNRDDAELASALEKLDINFDQVFREWYEKFCFDDAKVTEQLKALEVKNPNPDDLSYLLQGVADNFTRADLD